MTDHNRDAFEKWLVTTQYANDSLSFHNELFAAWQAALAEKSAQVPEGWKALTDVQWMNIVNHEHAWDYYSKEDAVHEAVKMTEEKCKQNNSQPTDEAKEQS